MHCYFCQITSYPTTFADFAQNDLNSKMLTGVWTYWSMERRMPFHYVTHQSAGKHTMIRSVKLFKYWEFQAFLVHSPFLNLLVKGCPIWFMYTVHSLSKTQVYRWGQVYSYKPDYNQCWQVEWPEKIPTQQQVQYTGNTQVGGWYKTQVISD